MSDPSDAGLLRHALDRWHPEKIPGGEAWKQGLGPVDFPPEALVAGIRVELEHTDDPGLALEIAMDHLAEDLDYYEKLALVEGDEFGEPLFRGRPPPPGPYYHGTTTALIPDHGWTTLRPPTETGRQTEPRVQRRGRVFLTTDVAHAESYARRAVRVWGGSPLVLEVTPTGPLKQISARPGADVLHTTSARVDLVIPLGP